MLFYQPLASSGINYLDEEESRHATKVLRLKEHDHIKIVDGKGVFYESVITEADSKTCRYEIQDSYQEFENKHHYIHIAIAPTKNPDRMEWFTEKSVEFGIDEISFLICEHSERKHFNIKRIEKKAISAMKQSLKASLPSINEPVTLSEFLAKEKKEEYKFIAYVDKEIPKHLKEVAPENKSYCVLIGPEGDFSKEEIGMAMAHEYLPIHLGKSRLRTETAGMAACHILNIINNF